MIWSMAWRNLGRHRRRTALTAITLAFSVAACIGLSTWMGGFAENVRVAIVDRQVGHFQVHHPDYATTRNPYDTVEDAEALLASLGARADVKIAAPRVLGYALFAGDDDEATTGGFVGVDPAAEASMTALSDHLVSGAWIAASGDACVGKKLAEDLGAGPGDDLLVVTNALDGSIGNRVFRISGVFDSGNIGLDSGAYVSLDDARDLLAMDDAVHEVVVVTNDARAIEASVATTQAAFPKLSVQPWWEVAPEALEAQGMQDAVLGIFSVVILGLASFIIINTLLMSVYERTRELGVLAAVGMRPRQIVGLVLAESFGMGTMAALSGLALGLLGTWYLAEVGVSLAVGDDQGFRMGGVVLDPLIRARFDLRSVLVPTLLLYAVSVLGGLWPALRAARLDPVTAMRQE
jgi:ABC-type lipoprotein release transport system permease subunit